MSTTSKSNNRAIYSLVIFLIFLVSSIVVLVSQLTKTSVDNPFKGNTPAQQAEISIAYAPELEPIYTTAIDNFNDSYKQNKNPLTGKNLENGDFGIKVTGQKISSGEARTQIVNSLNGAKDYRPTIYSPTASTWLDLVNYESSQKVFDLNNFKSVAKSPVGIAIWESRLKAIESKSAGQEIGILDIQKVANSPKGWQDYQASINRQQVYFGFTNPQISTTAVSALLSQYYTFSDPNIDQLTLQEVDNNQIQQQVQNFQKIIRQYSNNTVVFREYLGRGPDYIDMLPLAENDLIYVNRGQGGSKPAEKLVMLYPKEGSIVHDYPLAIPEIDWVTPDQRKAAEIFVEYLLSEPIQKSFLENGFRPASDKVSIGSPISEEFGVNPSKPNKILKIPTGEVISKLQLNFDFVKKPAKIALMVDTSGSMSGQKIENARKALEIFVEKSSPKN